MLLRVKNHEPLGEWIYNKLTILWRKFVVWFLPYQDCSAESVLICLTKLSLISSAFKFHPSVLLLTIKISQLAGEKSLSNCKKSIRVQTLRVSKYGIWQNWIFQHCERALHVSIPYVLLSLANDVNLLRSTTGEGNLNLVWLRKIEILCVLHLPRFRLDANLPRFCYWRDTLHGFPSCHHCRQGEGLPQETPPWGLAL